jgi:vacuolar-type H+-ATPase subunit I/STV1
MGYITAEGVDVASALGNLSSALDVVAAVGKHVEQRYQELEKWEHHLKAMEAAIAKREEELKGKEEEFKKREVEAKAQQNEHAQEKAKTKKKKKECTLRDCKFSSKINLNVGMCATRHFHSLFRFTYPWLLGGRLFATTKSTLLQFRGSYLESLITNEKAQENGEYVFFLVSLSSLESNVSYTQVLYRQRPNLF